MCNKRSHRTNLIKIEIPKSLSGPITEQTKQRRDTEKNDSTKQKIIEQSRKTEA